MMLLHVVSSGQNLVFFYMRVVLGGRVLLCLSARCVLLLLALDLPSWPGFAYALSELWRVIS